MFDENIIREAVRKAISSVQEKIDNKDKVVVGVSQCHIHLSREHLDILFGKGYELTIKKYLMGREYASEECVTLVGPSLKSIEKVRVLGPVRANTQVEISKTDTFILKVSPPVRPSGKIEGSEKMVIVGPKGVVYLNEGVIIANRHIHLEPKFAEENGIKDNDYVDVLVDSVKPTKFYDVQVRVRDDFRNEMHIDTDDANSAGIKNGTMVTIIKK